MAVACIAQGCAAFLKAPDVAISPIADSAPASTTVHRVPGAYAAVHPIVQQPAWVDDWLDLDFPGASLSLVLSSLADTVGVRAQISPGVLEKWVDAVHVRVKGPAGDVIQRLAGRFDLSVSMTHDAIRFSDVAVETFDLPTIGGRSTFRIGSGGDIGSSDGGFDHGDGHITVTGDAVSVDGLIEQLSTIDPSVRVAASEDSGTLTAVAPPSVMSFVREAVDAWSDAVTRQVILDVELLHVEADDERGGGFIANLTDVLSRGSVRVGGALSGALGGDAPFAVALDSSLASHPTGTVGARLSAAFSNLRVVTRSRVSALSGHVAHVSLTSLQAYLASSTRSESTAASGTFETQQLDPGVVESGFTLMLLPRAVTQPSGDTVVLQVAMRLAALEEIESIEVGDQRIQIPRTTQARFVHRALLSVGQPLVIGGLTRIDAQRLLEATGFAFGRSKTDRRSETLLVITPVSIQGS